MVVVGIQGSPSEVSRSGALLSLALARLRPLARETDLIQVRQLPAQAVLHAQFDHEDIRAALRTVERADVLLIATPIYKAAYSGALKAFLDLLPQDALRGRTVLPLATGGSVAHLLALDYALKPVLSALGARHILDSVFATDAQMAKDPERGYVPSPELEARLERALSAIVSEAEAVRKAAATWPKDSLATGLDATPWPRPGVLWAT